MEDRQTYYYVTYCYPGSRQHFRAGEMNFETAEEAERFATEYATQNAKYQMPVTCFVVRCEEIKTVVAEI